MESRFERIAGLVAPVILVLVALIALWQTTARDQSSWSGAGFGMFATIDGEATRQVRVFLEGTGQPLPRPPELQRQELDVRVLPSEARMERLGLKWAAGAGIAAGEVLVIEVWTLAFDGSTGTLSRTLLRRVEVEA